MAHIEQIEFCKTIRNKFPDFFREKIVVDIGSFDVNGSNRYLFENSLYLGIDVAPGKNVDFVSAGGDIRFPDESVDVVISTECFEHDHFYQKTLNNILRMLKPGGLFLFSCATTGRPEHGTARTTPGDAPLLQDLGEWANYYKNLDENDIREAINVDDIFEKYKFDVNTAAHDLYFFGFKKGNFVARTDYSFSTEAQKSKQKIAQLEDDLKKLNSENVRLEQVIADIYSSKSWRFTKPLREILACGKKMF